MKATGGQFRPSNRADALAHGTTPISYAQLVLPPSWEFASQKCQKVTHYEKTNHIPFQQHPVSVYQPQALPQNLLTTQDQALSILLSCGCLDCFGDMV